MAEKPFKGRLNKTYVCMYSYLSYTKLSPMLLLFQSFKKFPNQEIYLIQYLRTWSQIQKSFRVTSHYHLNDCAKDLFLISSDILSNSIKAKAMWFSKFFVVCSTQPSPRPLRFKSLFSGYQMEIISPVVIFPLF